MKPIDYLNSNRIEYIAPFTPAFTRNQLKVRVAASINNLTAAVKEMVDDSKPSKIVFKSGCGSSTIAVAQDFADCYASSINFNYWDVCAGDVLIKAMGGYSTDIDGKRYSFKNEANPKINGLLAYKTPGIHTLVSDRRDRLRLYGKRKYESEGETD